MGQYQYGQIVQANAPDHNGNWKIRPVVIITPTDEIVSDEPIIVICVSTQIERPIPEHHVKLPWQRGRHPRTGLDQENVAKCNWMAIIYERDIMYQRGFAPSAQLAKINEILSRIESGDYVIDCP